MLSHPGAIVSWFWILHIAGWFTSAIFSKKARQEQTGGERLLQSIWIWAAAILLFGRTLVNTPLGLRFVPQTPVTLAVGIAVLFAGGAIAWWARLIIGRNWSASVQIKQDHELVQRGPYRFVRHPIYTGFLFSLVGTAIVIGQWRGVLAVVLAFIGWLIKSRQEETFMTQQFGAKYDEYRRHTKAIIPLIY
jgi:protein-S-isoprenylcysteine O-methyltransferase Ste14